MWPAVREARTARAARAVCDASISGQVAVTRETRATRKAVRPLFGQRLHRRPPALLAQAVKVILIQPCRPVPASRLHLAARLPLLPRAPPTTRALRHGHHPRPEYPRRPEDKILKDYLKSNVLPEHSICYPSVMQSVDHYAKKLFHDHFRLGRPARDRRTLKTAWHC
jgi:hypothetical protein